MDEISRERAAEVRLKFFLARQIQRVHQAEEAHLTPQQALIMLAFIAMDSYGCVRLNQKELGRLLGMSQQSMTNALKPLRNGDFITKVSKNKSGKYYTVTRLGQLKLMDFAEHELGNTETVESKIRRSEGYGAVLEEADVRIKDLLPELFARAKDRETEGNGVARSAD